MTTDEACGVRVERFEGLERLFPDLSQRLTARGVCPSEFEVMLITERRGEGPCRPREFASDVVSVARVQFGGCRFFFCSRTGFVKKPTHQHLRLWKGMGLSFRVWEELGLSLDLSDLDILSEERCTAFDKASGTEGFFYAGVAEVEGEALGEIAGMMAEGSKRESSFLYLTRNFLDSPIAHFEAVPPQVELESIFHYKEGPLEPFGLLDSGIPRGDGAIFFLHNGDENEAYILKGRK